MKVFVSNRLETLADILKEQLFQSGGHPLDKRWVVVPSEQIRQALLFRWAQDDELTIATGVKLVSWSQALRRLFPSIPTRLELALKIERLLTEIDDASVVAYLSKGGHHRLSALSDHLSRLFLKYQPDVKLQGWQRTLWDRLFCAESLCQPFDGAVYFFHCWHMTPDQLAALKEMEATCFLFSPCALYWGDLQTFREQRYLLKQTSGAEQQQLNSYFQNDHPLLANWGKRGRELLELFESEEGFEAFETPQERSLLTTLQEEMLELTIVEKPVDDSIQVHSATSRLKEVEIVWELIHRSPFEPSEILVFAPTIHNYAAAIELVFQQRSSSYDYAIFGVEAKTESPTMRGFDELINLPKYRFARERVERLLFSPPFLKKFKLTLEEVKTLQEWLDQFFIRYDLKNFHPSSWFAGLKRMVESFVEGRAFDLSETDLLSRLVEIFHLFEQHLADFSEQMTMAAWGKKLKTIAEAFFEIDSDDEMMREFDRIQRLRVEGEFPFETIHRILHEIFHQPTASVNGSHLQAVKFTSLDDGTLMPAKMVIIMGMEEGSFPRQEMPSSLQQIPLPNRIDDDRYLVLESVCHARKQLIFTYSRIHPQDGKSQKPCSLVEELVHHCGLSIVDHTSTPVERKVPTITEVAKTTDEKGRETRYTVAQLKKLARHPLQYYLEEGHQIRMEWEDHETEFLLSPLVLSRLYKESCSIDELLEKLKMEGQLPVGLFGTIASAKIRDELNLYQSSLKTVGIQPTHIYSIELTNECDAPLQLSDSEWIYPALKEGEIIIEGKIDNLTPQALLVHAEKTIATQRKIWPIYILAKKIFPDLALLYTKKGVMETFDVQGDALQRYLDYATKALRSPSPFFPQKYQDDTIVTWAERRNLLPPDWMTAWDVYLKEQLHELF